MPNESSVIWLVLSDDELDAVSVAEDVGLADWPLPEDVVEGVARAVTDEVTPVARRLSEVVTADAVWTASVPAG